MLTYEFRIPMPLSSKEYRIGQLYGTLKASLNETGGGEGVEILENRPYEGGGQYTKKVYFLQSKVPKLVGKIAPKGSLELHEESWNTYPTGETRLSNSYLKDKFFIRIKTVVIDDDDGGQENIFELKDKALKKRKIKRIDIANDEIKSEDYEKKEDPSRFKSKIGGGRGPLPQDWLSRVRPSCSVYKLVKCQFDWWLQKKIEDKIMEIQQRFFTLFHRRIFCWLDEWVRLNMAEVRQLEKEVQTELKKQRASGEVRGVRSP